MICPYCNYECGALEKHGELGLICARCKDEFLKWAKTQRKCSVCGAYIPDCALFVTTSSGHIFCEYCLMDARRRFEEKKKRMAENDS